MEVTVFRIDDRLIHGQIVTAWLAHSNAKQIICADDKAAKDDLQKMMLEMSTPNGVKLHVISIADAIELIENDNSDVPTLLLCRGTHEASDLIDALPSIKSINVGNLNMTKGKEKVLSNVWVDQHDIDGFKKIHEKGIELEVRAVPNDKSQNVIELLKSSSLI